MSEPSIEELRSRLEMRDRQMAAVHRISAALFSKKDSGSLLRETLNVALETVDADAGSLLLYDSERGKLVFQYVLGEAAPMLTGKELDPEVHVNSKAVAVFRTGESIITNDTGAGIFDASIDRSTGYRTESILTVPLRNLGEPIGVMQAVNRRHGDFDTEDLELLEIISSLASTSIVNATLAEESQLAAVAHAVGDLGHDIKNALTPIETALQTLIQGFIEPMFRDLDSLCDRLQSDDRHISEEITAATHWLRAEYPFIQASAHDGCADIREMVSEIADYIKGVQSTNFVLADICPVVEERLRRIKVLANNRRVNLHLETGASVRSFAFDRRLVGRAVFNLVNNALGAISDAVKRHEIDIPQSGFNVWVSVSEELDEQNPDGGYCLIAVKDDGPGVPDRVKATLFTTHTISTTPGGTGIGTRFVKSVADAHGGTVGVESQSGRGARFWIRLPLRQQID